MPPTEAPPKRMGFLWKEGHKVRSWKRRYFVLDGGHLDYYESEYTHTAALGTIALRGARMLDPKTPRNR